MTLSNLIINNPFDQNLPKLLLRILILYKFIVPLRTPLLCWNSYDK